MKKRMWSVAIFFSALLVNSICANTSNPVELLDKANQELQVLLHQEESGGTNQDVERRERIKELVNGIFDFEELGRKALGSAKYSALSAEKQKEFVKSFKEMVEVSSLKKLDIYKSDSVVYEEPKYTRKGAKAKIKARSYYKGQETILVYKMLQVQDEWKAWDLVTDDLSTYRNYKEQFNSILKKKSIDELIQILKDKAKE